MAEGAVRPNPAFVGRFTPKAAHSRFERVCRGSGWLAKARVVCRLASACISGIPPDICGCGNWMGFESWHRAGTTKRAARANKAADRVIAVRTDKHMVPPPGMWLAHAGLRVCGQGGRNSIQCQAKTPAQTT